MKSASLILPLVAFAFALAGCTGGETSSQQSTSETAEPARFEISVGTKGFDPPVVEVEAGQSVTLVFTRRTEETCATEVVIPSEDLEVALPLNEPVEITLEPARKGDIAFLCGMNMLRGKVVVN